MRSDAKTGSAISPNLFSSKHLQQRRAGDSHSCVFLQHVSAQQVATKVVCQQLVAHLLSFVIVCRFLALVGIVLSTNSAHPPARPDSDAEAGDFARDVCRRRRRRRKTKKGKGDNDDEGDATAASYSRYSSEHQREASIADQQRRCRDAAEENSHRLLPDNEYSDAAVSGTKLRREGLDRLLRDAERGEFRVLYFYSLSRLARESVIGMLILKRLVHTYGVRVISVTEGIDTERDSWELLATIVNLIHERFVKGLGEDVFRGQEGALLADYSVGDWCFGFGSEPVPGTEKSRRGRNAKPRMRYVVQDVEASWVLRIFRWFVIDRRSICSIVRELNSRNAP